MNAGIILAWAAALLFGVPITLIFWAHIYLALKDIFAAHASVDTRRMAETVKQGSVRSTGSAVGSVADETPDV